jgi:hypothetical protein
MTILSIVGALILDFLFLPALLLVGRSGAQPVIAQDAAVLPSEAY